MKKNTCIFLFVLCGAFLFSCGQGGTDENSAEIKTITPVTVSNVRFGPIAESVDLNAVSEFQVKISVKATVTGYIESVNTGIGNSVAAGQVLFIIKTKEASALAGSGIDSLLKFSGVIKIPAEKSGTITSMVHQKGDYVQEGDELAVISDRSSLVFVLQVPFEMNSFIKTGKDISIILPGDSMRSGKITGIFPQVDAASQTQQYIVKISGDQALPENLVAKARIIKNTKANATIIPKTALLSDEMQKEFWVMKLIDDSTAVKVPVEKGIENDSEVEILSPPFTAGDKLLVSGNYGLEDTAKVSVQPEK